MKEKADNRPIVCAGEDIEKFIGGAGRKERISKSAIVRAAIWEFFNKYEDIESQILACGRNGGAECAR